MSNEACKFSMCEEYCGDGDGVTESAVVMVTGSRESAVVKVTGSRESAVLMVTGSQSPQW